MRSPAGSISRPRYALLWPSNVFIEPSADSDCASGYILPTIMEWGHCFNLRIGGRIFGSDLDEDDEVLCGLFFENGSVGPLLPSPATYTDYHRFRRLPPRSPKWSEWNAEPQCTLFEPLPTAMRPRVPEPWTVPPPPNDAVQITTGVLPVEKPTAKYKRSTVEETAKEKARFTAAERLKAKASTLRCNTLQELMALVRTP